MTTNMELSSNEVNDIKERKLVILYVISVQIRIRQMIKNKGVGVSHREQQMTTLVLKARSTKVIT